MSECLISVNGFKGEKYFSNKGRKKKKKNYLKQKTNPNC